MIALDDFSTGHPRNLAHLQDRRGPDITRARELLGFRPTVPLLTGLERTIADFRARLAERLEEVVAADHG